MLYTKYVFKFVLALIMASFTLNSQAADFEDCMMIYRALHKAQKDGENVETGLEAYANSCLEWSKEQSVNQYAISLHAVSVYYRNLEKYEKQLPLLKKMFEIAPDTRADYWTQIELALAYRQTKQYEQAIELLKSMLDKEGGSMPIYYHLALTYFDMKDYQKTVDSITLGLPYQDDYFGAYWYRALAFDKLGQKDKAHQDLESINAILKVDCGGDAEYCPLGESGQFNQELTDLLKKYGISPEL